MTFNRQNLPCPPLRPPNAVRLARFQVVRLIAGVLILHLVLLGSTSALRADDSAVDFARDINPILAANCYRLPRREETRVGLAARRARRANSRGATAGRRSWPERRQKVCSCRRSLAPKARSKMPPKGPGAKRRTNRAASSAGSTKGPSCPVEPPAAAAARKSDHWSFQPLGIPLPPEVEAEQAGRATPSTPSSWRGSRRRWPGTSPEADKATLIRRLSLDLIGLPPSVAEVDAFLADTRARRLRAVGRPAAGVAPLRRTLGAALARRGPLRRLQRLHDRQRPLDLEISRLGDRRLQPRPAIRRFVDRAVGRRPARRGERSIS